MYIAARTPAWVIALHSLCVRTMDSVRRENHRKAISRLFFLLSFGGSNMERSNKHNDCVSSRSGSASWGGQVEEEEEGREKS